MEKQTLAGLGVGWMAGVVIVLFGYAIHADAMVIAVLGGLGAMSATLWYLNR
ncbi:MAG TPA: hypothetical protein VIY48_15235 [Candidatus Paceibacterota bacterium]